MIRNWHKNYLKKHIESKQTAGRTLQVQIRGTSPQRSRQSRSATCRFRNSLRSGPGDVRVVFLSVLQVLVML